MGFEKTMGGGLTSVVQIILTKECRLVNMSSPNADVIAVSLSCPKNPKNPYLLSRRLETRGIAIQVQSNFGIFDIYWSTLNLV